MDNKDLIKLLQSMKDEPELGGGFDADTSWQRVASHCGFDQDAKPRKYAFREYLEYIIFQSTHAMVKPVAISFAVFLVAITGWVSAANVSSNALPGDQMYPVKIGMEQMQLTLAFNDDQRAALQVEFAGRRLDEMVVVAATRAVEQPESMHLALKQVRQQVETIQEKLTEDSESGDTELAKAIGRKVQTYQATVSNTQEVTTEAAEEMQQVQDILETTEETVVDVIITAHELTEDAESEQDLKEAFEKELEAVIALYGDAAADQIEIATALKDEGAYRRAFQVLREIEFLSTQTDVLEDGVGQAPLQ
jgi:hypothetical protein